MLNTSCYPSSIGFDKEAFEMGDNVILNEEIYFLEGGQTDEIGGFCSSFYNLENYLRGKMWVYLTAEVFLHSGSQHYSISAVFKIKRKHRIHKCCVGKSGFRGILGKFKRSAITDWGYRPVFIGVIQISKYGEELQFRAIPSMVRLKIVNNSLNTTRPIGEVTLAPTSIPPNGIKDGELASGFRDGSAGADVEFVGDMVKGTPQIMSEISSQQPPVLGESITPLNEILQILPRIILGDGIWVSLKETPDASLQHVKVTLRPANFEIRPV